MPAHDLRRRRKAPRHVHKWEPAGVPLPQQPGEWSTFIRWSQKHDFALQIDGTDGIFPAVLSATTVGPERYLNCTTLSLVCEGDDPAALRFRHASVKLKRGEWSRGYYSNDMKWVDEGRVPGVKLFIRRPCAAQTEAPLQSMLTDMLTDDEYKDFTVEYRDGTTDRGHKCVLVKRSRLIRGILSSGLRGDGERVIIDDMTPIVGRKMFNFMYTDKLDLDACGTDELGSLISAADKYQVPGLADAAFDALPKALHGTPTGAWALLRRFDGQQLTENTANAVRCALRFIAAEGRTDAAEQALRDLAEHDGDRKLAAAAGAAVYGGQVVDALIGTPPGAGGAAAAAEPAAKRQRR